MTYRSRRNLLSAIPTNTIAYHLFDIQYSADKSNYSIKLLRNLDESIASLDFDSTGEFIATVGDKTCLISEINTQYHSFRSALGTEHGNYSAYVLFSF